MGSHLTLRAHALRSEHEHLYTFREIRGWYIATCELAHEIERAMQNLRSQLEHLRSQADSLARSHSLLPVLERLFTPRAHERELRNRADLLERSVLELGTSLNALLECVDYSPSDHDECSTILAELRAHRNALLAPNETEARASSRVLSITESQRIYIFNRKASPTERRTIRRLRAATLAPYEDRAAALDRQLRELDRHIRWVERFDIAR